MTNFWKISKNWFLILPPHGLSYQDDLIYVKHPLQAKFFATFQIFKLSSRASEKWSNMCWGRPINKTFFSSKIAQKFKSLPKIWPKTYVLRWILANRTPRINRKIHFEVPELKNSWFTIKTLLWFELW